MNFLLKWNKNFLPPLRGALINVSNITYVNTYMLFLEVKHGLAKLIKVHKRLDL